MTTIGKLRETLGQLAGAASLCWEPKPTGVFDPEAATEFVKEAEQAIIAWALECVGPKGSYLAMDDLHKDAYKAQDLLKEHIRAKLTGDTK